MISFVWPDSMTFVPWAGGSETYTLEHVRELQRRGIPTRIIARNKKVANSLAIHPDIPMLAIKHDAELSKLDDTLIYVMHTVGVPTKKQSYIILHVPIKGVTHDDTALFTPKMMGTTLPIATSKFMAEYWQERLHVANIPVVYPAIDAIFSEAPRTTHKGAARVLFAGRPTQEKGIYVLLASLHMPPLQHKDFSLTVVETINHQGGADVIYPMLRAHPRIHTIPARQNRASMARMYTDYDIVVMPSSNILWKEAFGMIAVEAQRAGCRVVASNNGGLPETDCGLLTLVAPDDPLSLAQGIASAIDQGPVTARQRKQTAAKFTAAASVDTLLDIIGFTPEK